MYVYFGFRSSIQSQTVSKNDQEAPHLNIFSEKLIHKLKYLQYCKSQFTSQMNEL